MNQDLVYEIGKHLNFSTFRSLICTNFKFSRLIYREKVRQLFIHKWRKFSKRINIVYLASPCYDIPYINMFIKVLPVTILICKTDTLARVIYEIRKKLSTINMWFTEISLVLSHQSRYSYFHIMYDKFIRFLILRNRIDRTSNVKNLSIPVSNFWKDFNQATVYYKIPQHLIHYYRYSRYGGYHETYDWDMMDQHVRDTKDDDLLLTCEDEYPDFVVAPHSKSKHRRNYVVFR